MPQINLLLAILYHSSKMPLYNKISLFKINFFRYFIKSFLLLIFKKKLFIDQYISKYYINQINNS